MKFRIIIAGAALLAALIGIRCLIQYAHSPRRAAVGIAMELASKMSKPPGGSFEMIQTSFLDSYDNDVFYVVLDFRDHTAGDKLQEVFYFDALDGKPKMEWSYSVFKNLTKLNVSDGAFVGDERAQIHRKGNGFELPIALTPVEWQFQAETIARLASQGVEMLVSIEGHPELKPFRIVGLTDLGDCLAEFSSRDDALLCAKILEIKVNE